MYDLIIFDLDGVLIDSKEVHYKALNMALSEVDERYSITTEEHLKIYDGLPTRKKLILLNEQKGLPNEYFDKIWQRKQEITVELLKSIKKNNLLIKNFELLKSKNILLACASNSISSTVEIILKQLGILKYFDLVLSNESVNFPKPHPEMYWKAMSVMSCLPEETMIIEDSPYGLLAASRSKSYILRVKNTEEVTLNNIINKLKQINMGIQQTIPAWRDKDLNVLSLWLELEVDFWMQDILFQSH